MNTIRLLAAPLFLLATVGATADEPYPDTHPEVGVRRSVSEAGESYEASVAGEVLDWTLRATDGNAKEIYLLAAPETAADELRSLYRVDLESETLILLDQALDSSFDRLLALDLDADGRDELLLSRQDSISQVCLEPSGDYCGLTTRVTARGIDLAGQVVERRAPSRNSSLSLMSAGTLRRFEVTSTQGASAATGSDSEVDSEPDSGPGKNSWGLVSRQTIPRQSERFGHGLRLTSPPVELLHLDDGPVYAIGPEATGRNRLRVELRSLDGSERREMWCQLPGQETVQSSRFDVLEGRSVLVVTTNSSDKIGIFEKQTLHLFTLAGDRTRSGNRPSFSIQTESRRWQSIKTEIADVDADGKEDLVVFQVDGLGSGKLVAETFLGRGRGRFEPKSRKTTLDIPPRAWSYGSDLTADGQPDLVIFGEDSLSVYPARASRKKGLFERQPRWSFSGSIIPRPSGNVSLGDDGIAIEHDRGSAIGVPEVVDIDGDGSLELILAENPRWGFGRLRIHFPAYQGR